MLNRQAPLKYRDDQEVLDLAGTLAGSVQRFADVLERELREIEI
ncbi:MAG: hypothetical protein QM270_09455 [Bacillota bacterium]|nr:hypothetical protein [Bacillota bacterium]